MKGGANKASAQGKQGGGGANKKSSSLTLDTSEGTITTKKVPASASMTGKQPRADKGTGGPSMRSPLSPAPVVAKKARGVVTAKKRYASCLKFTALKLS
jgi:hypothetical protein